MEVDLYSESLNNDFQLCYTLSSSSEFLKYTNALVSSQMN